MDDFAIKTIDLGKKYKINKSLGEFRNLREDLTNFLRGKRKKAEDFWALQSLTLEIKHGEAVGIIGKNGSGKSTLLKLLSQVTWPTTGQIELCSRPGSLLEVGTGFHIELTGRENVFLCGAILGMSRQEVLNHFAEIVKFSGVEKFLDVPVKKYSSGMYLRLAFSVMAHLKSDILIIDEVIAVGDKAFQEKCLNKMKQLANEGRTVILVSHQLTTLRDFCTRILWLDKGKLIVDGPAEEVLEAYESSFPQLVNT